MGECGPTATIAGCDGNARRYSRWGNAGQLQLQRNHRIRRCVIADGGMRANCNSPLVIVDTK